MTASSRLMAASILRRLFLFPHPRPRLALTPTLFHSRFPSSSGGLFALLCLWAVYYILRNNRFRPHAARKRESTNKDKRQQQQLRVETMVLTSSLKVMGMAGLLAAANLAAPANAFEGGCERWYCLFPPAVRCCRCMYLSLRY